MKSYRTRHRFPAQPVTPLRMRACLVTTGDFKSSVPLNSLSEQLPAKPLASSDPNSEVPAAPSERPKQQQQQQQQHSAAATGGSDKAW